MTLPSVLSLLTGRVPGRHGVVSNLMELPEGAETLATRLHQAGFRTGAFVGNVVLRHESGAGRGFDHYTESFRTDEKLTRAPEQTAELLTDAALAWLDQQDEDERLFLWVHYQEPHGPYQPRHFETRKPCASEVELPQNNSHSGREGIPRYQWLGHGCLDEYEARYDAEIAELDEPLGRLIEGLRKRGMLDRGALVFTADHGEAFGEEGVYCAHGEGLGEALLHVPLLLRVAGETPGTRSDRVGVADVSATLLELAGIPSRGGSLLANIGDRTVVAQMLGEVGDWNSWRSIRSGSLELVEREPRPGKSEPPAAPGLEELRAALDVLAPWPAFGGSEVEQLSAAERDALRELGYLDD